jgi:hypothetical protein
MLLLITKAIILKYLVLILNIFDSIFYMEMESFFRIISSLLQCLSQYLL